MQEEWVIDILRQCRAASVPFFFRQWGGVHKSRRGRKLLGRTFDDLPKRPFAPIPPVKERRKLLEKLELAFGSSSEICFRT
jgi:hypothetical protein